MLFFYIRVFIFPRFDTFYLRSNIFLVTKCALVILFWVSQLGYLLVILFCMQLLLFFNVYASDTVHWVEIYELSFMVKIDYICFVQLKIDFYLLRLFQRLHVWRKLFLWSFELCFALNLPNNFSRVLNFIFLVNLLGSCYKLFSLDVFISCPSRTEY